jgi:tetratricopeptide (TPR) repeat protein
MNTLNAQNPLRRLLAGPALRRLAAGMLALGALSSAGCGMIAKGRNVDGVRYFQQANYQMAAQRFQAALQANPRDADGYYNLAAVTHRTGLQNKDPNLMVQAESLYNQCLDLNPNHVECRRGLAVLLTETNRTDRAIVMLKNWSVSSPKSSDAHIELARLYEETSDTRAAELQLNEALQLNPNDWRALAALGRIREQAGDYPQALANYQRAISINRSAPQLAERVAVLQKQYAAAPYVAPITQPLTGLPQTAAAPRRYPSY